MSPPGEGLESEPAREPGLGLLGGAHVLQPALVVVEHVVGHLVGVPVDDVVALALQQAGAGSVDFATIWGQGHTMAELTGTGEENFIAWVTKQASS